MITDELHEAMRQVLDVVPPVLRVTFVSIDCAVDVTRHNARQQGITLSDRVGLTRQELDELAASRKLQ